MFDFPDLVLVTRHGCEPCTGLANSRGADKIIHAGYFPMGLTLDRIMSELPGVLFKDSVWPKFLHDNAARVLKI